MLIFILALISFPVTAIIASFLLHPSLLERQIQWRGKTLEYWAKKGVYLPGERLPFVSFIFGVLNTTISKICALFGAGVIFHWAGETIPILFIYLVFVINMYSDINRIAMFNGNSGVHKERGYLVGDLIGFSVFVMYYYFGSRVFVKYIESLYVNGGI
ncbi:MAG: hypothetical protein HN343_00460 [Candidatus Thioglobus sp.]|jgi:hypothetical protein|uniref:hypothetical protein n=1 Tax=Candidatus Thioglobus sp. TaxID=2026721 RepID=UPI001ECBF817|nr:hypothetical protein [Candidatus Thioglobus sp.]MBT3186070.1 hypothetical protein [Candidatus Thioglobus sp.]MBT5290877.1 hypothetical protein [Thiotrichales bacterium]